MNFNIGNFSVKKKYKVDNAIIMAAGISSRFSPISYEYPKALLKIRGEILIERQIMQLKEAGIDDITIVVGYKKELFYYLQDKYKVNIVNNPEYVVRNNNSTLYYVKDKLSNTYICSADNYFNENVFDLYADNAYYSAVFQEGNTDEWCISTNDKGLIIDVSIGGSDAWVMLGHAFFTNEFSKKFVNILDQIYDYPDTRPLLWESIYKKYINQLQMYIRKYPKGIIFEFDTLDELRSFDASYWDYSGSDILRQVCKKLNCKEREITKTKPLILDNKIIGFEFIFNSKRFKYLYNENLLLNGDEQND